MVEMCELGMVLSLGMSECYWACRYRLKIIIVLFWDVGIEGVIEAEGVFDSG